ncbi:hypothetical protein IMCC3317_09130 [Kordia antarctica]|uniref:DUF885 domain-containing protein n=1 Tax=Kordia antarctica TaxID=1218801 RepID=A0A7L4ZGJ6_9FLAO|nr:DUF885 family protein [Kordia antarctica]QHI35567.1 hypothetical protein IMCC3317_09130 [Kordia antarctica]
MKLLNYILFGIFLFSFKSYGQQSFANWNAFETAFVKDFERLHINDLQIYYVDNLELIQSERNIAKQEQLFLKYKKAIANLDRESLTKDQKIDYEVVIYEINLHLERIQLEKKWLLIKPKRVSTEGLQSIPMGKEWYVYFLKKWVDAEVTPDGMFQFGLSEIDRAKKAMNAIEEASGLDSLEYQKYLNRPIFFHNSEEAIQNNFEIFKKELLPNLIGAFPKVDQLPDVFIERGKNEAYAQVPAYYAEQRSTFYYNFFDKPFNKRQIAWIYFHEAIPGHHYQIKFEEQLEKSKIKQLFEYNGYREGWAAYVEELIHEFGTYTTKYDELGKWEWDIIRSVRVSMDVGLNYYDWSDEKALQFWQEHIKGQDDIAQREITRMKRWPAQVITYKYGADKILKWKAHKAASLPQGKEFPWLWFHTKILENGALPFSVMDKVIFD